MREINIKTICRKLVGGEVWFGKNSPRGNYPGLLGSIGNHGGTRIEKKTSLFSVVEIGCSPSPYPNANTARMATSFYSVFLLLSGGCVGTLPLKARRGVRMWSQVNDRKGLVNSCNSFFMKVTKESDSDLCIWRAFGQLLCCKVTRLLI